MNISNNQYLILSGLSGGAMLIGAVGGVFSGNIAFVRDDGL